MFIHILFKATEKTTDDIHTRKDTEHRRIYGLLRKYGALRQVNKVMRRHLGIQSFRYLEIIGAWNGMLKISECESKEMELEYFIKLIEVVCISRYVRTRVCVRRLHEIRKRILFVSFTSLNDDFLRV